MVSLDLKDYEPPNPFEHAANALDGLAFIAGWPKKMREARLTVVKVLRALRDIERVPGGMAAVEAGTHVRDSSMAEVWETMVDAILNHAPPELLEAAKS